MRVTFLASTILIAICLCGMTPPESVRSTEDASEEKIFGSATYFVERVLVPHTVTLKNGAYVCPSFLEYPKSHYLRMEPPCRVGKVQEHEVYYEHKYVYADFNHDGLTDAAVLLFELFGGNCGNYVLAFMINDGHKFIHSASQQIDGCDPDIRSIQEKNDKVLINMYVHREDDAHGRPTKHVRKVYKYPGDGKF